MTFPDLCTAMDAAGVEVHVLADERSGHRIRLMDFHRVRSLELPVTRGFDAEVVIACCSLAICPEMDLARQWPELVALARDAAAQTSCDVVSEPDAGVRPN